MIVELAVTAGPHAGRSFRFAEHATFIVGRSTQAHFSLPEKDPHVSRLHVLVEVNPPLCRLRNMSAVNGTVVNGAQVVEADLRDGDRVTIGMTELTVRLRPPLPGDAAPTVGLPAAGVAAPGATATHPPPGQGSFESALMALARPATDAAQARHDSPGAGAPGGPATVATAPPDLAGYLLERELGRGGMGVVYRAVHLASGDAVAVKTVLPRAQVGEVTLAKFAREAAVLGRLDHPGIVKFRDGGVDSGVVWFAMEFVPGADAQASAAAAGSLAVGRAVGWVVQALGALAHAHGRGFVHRDVKPANLLVAAGPGGSEVVKLADFGLARAYEASPLSGLTLTGAAGGTPPFMPPEQVLDMRSVKPAADQYAAAATLYRLLSGQHVYPPSSTVQELFARILQTDPVPLTAVRPDLPGGLTAAVHRALSRDAAARFPDCLAFAAALRPFAN